MRIFKVLFWIGVWVLLTLSFESGFPRGVGSEIIWTFVASAIVTLAFVFVALGLAYGTGIFKW